MASSSTEMVLPKFFDRGDLPDRHRPARLDDVEESLAPGLDLGFGRAGPSYGTSLINRRRGHSDSHNRQSSVGEMLVPQLAQQRRQHLLGPLAILEAFDQFVGFFPRNY